VRFLSELLCVRARSILFGSPLKSLHDDLFRFHPQLVRARVKVGTLSELEKAGAGVARFSS
jgi:hypothetical protein